LNSLNTLKDSTYFLAEDTRVFKSLLKSLEIDFLEKKIFSFHDHSSEAKLNKIINMIIEEDVSFVLVSDAGSPVICDPAYPLIKKCLENNIEIKSFSGVSSILNALELSGFSTTPFSFYGFFPRDNKGKDHILNLIKSNKSTVVIFESTHRIIKSLEYISANLKNYNICVCRELTKTYETIYRFNSDEFDQIKSEITTKGEFVIIIESSKNNSPNIISNTEINKIAEDVFQNGPNKKNCSKLISKLLGIKSKEVYTKWTIS
jgi:16S rRNA (cytidine1402-2'-O)-methyltransferase